MHNVRYEELRPEELAAARDAASVVYFPIGSLEFHGRHLPVGLDAMDAYEVCLRAAQHAGGVVLPVTYWGTTGHDGYPGSLLLGKDTIAALVGDVLLRLTEQGYRLIVTCTGHYPTVQGALMKEVAAAHMDARPEARVLCLDVCNLCPGDERLTEHAGYFETSIMLHIRPDLVVMSELSHPDALDAIAPDCVDATEEYGRRRMATAVGEMVRLVREALGEL